METEAVAARKAMFSITKIIEEILNKLKSVHEYAPQYTYKSLLLLSDGDLVCDHLEGKKFAQKYGGDMMVKIYPHLYHDLLNEPEKQQVLADITKWLDDLFAQPQS